MTVTELCTRCNGSGIIDFLTRPGRVSCYLCNGTGRRVIRPEGKQP